MISTKQRTVALSTIAIAAAIVLFTSAPSIATHQAYAFWGGWWGPGWGWGWAGPSWFHAGSGGWFPWGPYAD